MMRMESKEALDIIRERIDLAEREYAEQAPEYIEALKLAETLLQAEEQGRMVVLPCKVGDTVYSDNGVFGILEYEVENIVIDKTITYLCSAYSKSIGDCPSECLDEIDQDISDFGKTVFLTREEAEAALKKMGGEKK